MADIGRALISKIISEEDMVTAMSAGIRPTWFEDDEHKRTYKWMLEYFERYGETPTDWALAQQYPNFKLLKVREPYDYYLDEFRQQRRRSIIVEGVINADEAVNAGDTKKAQEELSKALLRIGLEVSSLTDEDVIVTRRERIQTYNENRKNVGKLTGISTGFPTLDFVSGGFHDQQFIVIGGSAKQGKSFMLMKSAIAAQEAGFKVLFISFEMSVFEQTCRYDALCCGVNSMRLIQGNLTNEDMLKLKKGLRNRIRMQPFIISADISATTTVSGLAGKIEEHQPDIVFVDGVYLMENEIGADTGSTQSYTSISRGLKRLAQRIKKPVVTTTQALTSKMAGGKVTLNSLGWTSAWSQDADLILGVERLDEADLIKFRVVGGRNVSPMEMGVRCNWEDSTLEEVNLQTDEEDDDDD